MLYAVVNIDIVDSKGACNRDILQNKISQYISIVSDSYANVLVAPITVTLGDEWQAVIKDPAESYNIVQAFQQLFWNDDIDLYAGIGVGSIKTSISIDTRKMDGPCFINARLALEIAKKHDRDRKQKRSFKNRVHFYIEQSLPIQSHDEHMDEAAASLEARPKDDLYEDSIYSISSLGQVINALMENNEVLKSKMTNRQKSLINDFRRVNSYRELIEVSKGKYNSIGNISTMLNKAEYYVMNNNLELIKTLISNYCRLRGEIS